MRKNLLLLVWLLAAACKKDSATPDITTGLQLQILFDGSATEGISGATGNTYYTTYGVDRKGRANSAAYFNSNNSAYIDFGDLDNATLNENNFTISCWVLVTDTQQPCAVFSKRGSTGPWEYSLDNHFSNRVFNLDNWNYLGGPGPFGMDPLKASAPLHLQTWQHLVYTGNGNQLSVYVNGVLQSGTDVRNSGVNFSNTTGHFVVGNGGGYGKNYYFNGGIDDVRIYNRPLNTEAINYLYLH